MKNVGRQVSTPTIVFASYVRIIASAVDMIITMMSDFCME